MANKKKDRNEVARERYANSQCTPSSSAMKVERPTVAVLVPSYKQPHPRMQNAFTLLAEYSRKNGVEVFATPIIQSSIVHWTRNGLLAQLIKSGRTFTHVLFLDDDIVPAQDSLVRLVKHAKDVVAGLCTRRQDPPIPNARLYDNSTGSYHELWEWGDGLIEVSAVGTGLMLISRKALQAVAEAYFTCAYEREIYGVSDDWIAKTSRQRRAEFDEEPNAWWFRFLPKENGVGEYGEDISFCHMARKYCAIPIYVDTTIQPEHIGDYGYSIADFIAHREPVIARAKADGRYLAAPRVNKVAESRIVVVD